MIVDESSSRAQGRVLATAIGLAFLLFVLVLQLVRLQVLERHTLLEAARQGNSASAAVVRRARGNIVDQAGRLLATDIFLWEVDVSPGLISDEEALAQTLSPLIGLTSEEILERIRSAPSDAPYVVLAKGIEEPQGEKIADRKRAAEDSKREEERSLWLPVSVTPYPRRYYPQGSLAVHALGFVNIDGLAFFGVEGFYQEFLTGASVMRSGKVDDVSLPADFSLYIPSAVGRDLVLTLDVGVQHLVEKELRRAVEYYGAQAGTIIVMNPKTGEVLAMANEPAFDPNRYSESEDQQQINRAISWPYEPGSVVKVITLAAGLDSGKISPDQTFQDEGVLRVGDREIHNSDYRAHGTVTLTDILALSLNVGAAKISMEMGAETFYDYIKRFGFGRVTEIDLAGEVSGLIKTPDSSMWSPSDLVTNAYGQGMTVTPIQLITAVSAIANDGVAMHPRVVRMVVDHGRVIPTHPRPYQRAISVETARYMRQLMAEATARGIDANLVPGYKVAGKTGTAQIPTSTGYSDDEVITTYVAFLPADDPQIIILVTLDRPTRSMWASQVAVPVFQNIANRLVRMLHIPPDHTP
ncbi:MAG: penicillin-binding protein 2 [Chloroflexi bacterium]|nr:penicillin-binding protein 2 [Chloroflexota bacterium]